MSLSSLVVAGVNHRTTPMELRGLFSIDREALPGAFRQLHDLGITDCMVLSTCNRTELYALANNDEALIRFYQITSRLPVEEVAQRVTILRGEDAVRHLFQVASGLDSQVLGESEILGQVKKAWLAAKEQGFAGSYLDPLFQRALAVGKRVRSETDLGKHCVSIASLAIRLAEEQVFDLSDSMALVIGTGDMACRILKELAVNRPSEILIASRNPLNAARLAEQFSATPVSLDDIPNLLEEVDIVFAATNAQEPILTEDSFSFRRTEPQVLVDLGVPRNIATEVDDLLWTRLYDMEDLQSLSDAHKHARESEVPAAEAIIREEISAFIDWSSQRAVAPVIASLKDQAEELRQSLLDWASGKLGDISSEQMEVVDLLTQRMVKHFLRYPIAELRNSAGEAAAIEAVTRMIGMAGYKPDSCTSDSDNSVGSYGSEPKIRRIAA